MTWRKSAWSNPSGNCAELLVTPTLIGVRDSKDPDGPKLRFGPKPWAAFLADVKAGRYDLRGDSR